MSENSSFTFYLKRTGWALTDEAILINNNT